MSGTSADAVDAVLIHCRGQRFERVAGLAERRYPQALRRQLLELGRGSAPVDLERLCDIDAAVAETFAEAALDLLAAQGLSAAQISAIGSHGQTVFHRGGAGALTLQLGDPGRIAERTGITTVGDFRRRDIALGGQGAPLVPAFHHALFASAAESRAVLNLGGIANLTLLPDGDSARVRGFDTGPGNALLDEWAQRHTGAPYDADGRFAASGRVHEPVLAALLAEPYFALPPPKSTGRGDFHLDWLRARAPAVDALAPADVQATLAELAARGILQALERHQPATTRLLACGGGVRNADLMQRLHRLAWRSLRIETTQALGLAPQAVEGAAFAWLAMRTLDGATGSLPAVTGARRATILGGIYRA